MNNPLDANYWENRYQSQNSPWDAGSVTPPLQQCFDNLINKSLRILIPGAGYGHEAIYLHQAGFKDVFVCDWAPSAFETLLQGAPDFPKEHCLISDFFSLQVSVDLIVEQTFFCAINRSLRGDYVKKCHEILRPGGILLGLLWADEYFPQGPPFGGTKSEYLSLFKPWFSVLHMDLSHLSIGPRLGRELFFVCQKAFE